MTRPAPDLPAARWSALAVSAVSLTTLLWLPLSYLPIIDGLLFVAPPIDVARDLALLQWAGVVLVVALALVIVAIGGLCRAGGVEEAHARWICWVLCLAPLAGVIGWFFAHTGWRWVKALGLVGVVPARPWIAAASAVLFVAAVAVVRRIGWRTVVAFTARVSLDAGRPAAVLLLAGSLVIALNPPAVLPPSAAVLPPLRAADIASGSRPALVLMISLDTLAAADAEPCNPQSATMPNLAAFAQTASCFTRFYAVSNFTTAGTASMESGLLPWTHFATQPDATMRPGTREHALPARMRSAGWRTHFVTDNLLASPRHRGSFGAYDQTSWVPTSMAADDLRAAMTTLPATALPRLVSTALAFLGSFEFGAKTISPYSAEAAYAALLARLDREPGSAPVFAWLHSMPPHSPYLPLRSAQGPGGPDERSGALRRLRPENQAYPPEQQADVDLHRRWYRENIRAADQALGAFLRELERRGWLDDATVVVTSDHGESFVKGYLGHAGSLLHEDLIRIPLLIKEPRQRVGRRIDRPASQIDLAPTLLDLAGLQPLERAEGASLRPLLQGLAALPRPVYAMSMEHQSRFEPIQRGRFVAIDGGLKLTVALSPGAPFDAAVSLFEIEQDPGETRDLAQDRPQQVQPMLALLKARLEAAERARRLP